MYITAILIGINDTICKILAQFAIVVMNYVFSKFFVFTTGKSKIMKEKRGKTHDSGRSYCKD